MDILITLIWFTVWLTAAKAVFIGSEFDLILWYEYGSEYTDWYRKSRVKFPVR